MQRAHCLDFGFARKHAALELEVVEAITLLRRLGLAHHGIGGQCRLVAQPRPVVDCMRLAGIRQAGLRAVPNVEEVAQHLDRVALLAFAEQCGHRHIEMLSEQIEQRRFDRGCGVDRGAQVKGLMPAPP